METEDIFAEAEEVLERMEAANADAVDVASAIPRAVAAVVSGETRPADGARDIRALAAREAAAFAELPKAMEELVRSLDGAKARYAPARKDVPEAPKARKGLAAALGWKRGSRPGSEVPADFAADMEAQSAYAGRVERMARGAAAVDMAIGRIPALRKETDSLAFAIQEMAVSNPSADPKETYSLEDIASAMLARSDALGLHSRLLSSIDRTGEESHAMALEAHMDSLVDSLPG